MSIFLSKLKNIIFISISLSSWVYANEWEPPKKMTYPIDNKSTPSRVELGKLLFFDKRLSASDDISCASCHQPKKGWASNNAKEIGTNGKKGFKNTPTIVNSGYQTSYLWNGSITSLEAQAIDPITAKHEMNMPINVLVKKLSSIEGYQILFEKAYPKEGITKKSIAKALATFERTIISNNTLFDKWIKDKPNIAFADKAKEGFDLFTGKGKCKSCHGGFNFSFGNFENIGLGNPDFKIKSKSKNIWDNTFKVPTLREAAKTAPYFHDGSVHTLEESVHICGNAGRYKDAKRSPFFRDRNITMQEMHKIVAFIKTLSTEKNNFVEPINFPK